ncbi:MAG: hypothetical protein V1784_09815 [bacterium]
MMVSAIISLLIGALCLFLRGGHVTLPVVGLALGGSAILNGRRAGKSLPQYMGIAAVVLNGFVLIATIVKVYF